VADPVKLVGGYPGSNAAADELDSLGSDFSGGADLFDCGGGLHVASGVFGRSFFAYVFRPWNAFRYLTPTGYDTGNKVSGGWVARHGFSLNPMTKHNPEHPQSGAEISAESWWYNLKTLRAEKGMLAPAPNRVGPFKSEAEALAAPSLLAERARAWRDDEADD